MTEYVIKVDGNEVARTTKRVVLADVLDIAYNKLQYVIWRGKWGDFTIESNSLGNASGNKSYHRDRYKSVDIVPHKKYSVVDSTGKLLLENGTQKEMRALLGISQSQWVGFAKCFKNHKMVLNGNTITYRDDL